MLTQFRHSGSGFYRVRSTSLEQQLAPVSEISSTGSCRNCPRKYFFLLFYIILINVSYGFVRVRNE
jgi:hypothetical protein